VIKLNNILGLSNDEIKNSKIELNMKVGSGGIPFLESWLKSDENDRIEGTSNCSYWGWYGEKQRNFYPGQWVFSFIRMGYDEWLFISAAEIIDVPKDSWAVVSIIEKYKPLFGRLIIKYNKGQKFSRYVFNLSNCIENCEVKEILSCQYSGQQFEGYDRVYLFYRMLSDIFAGKIMPTYYEALKKITGIYCLTDKKTGKLYIGSASGEGGVAQRWGNYLDSKHGGNKKLIDLYKKEGPEYFEQYFTFTLLEYFGLSYDHDRIIAREQYWKNCFQTISNGYN